MTKQIYPFHSEKVLEELRNMKSCKNYNEVSK